MNPFYSGRNAWCFLFQETVILRRDHIRGEPPGSGCNNLGSRLLYPLAEGRRDGSDVKRFDLSQLKIDDQRDTDRPAADLRDRALIAALIYSFARITAALKMKVEDRRPCGAG
jgi:hypothetical protein